MAGKAARGAGTIRKKTVTRSGKTYTYWEARVTTGRDPGTGRQVQISITGKTQKEVREKMQAATVAVDSGTYIQPERMTVSEWLDIWTAEYLGGVKPNTVRIYRNNVKKHIKPALGAVRLPELRPHMIQAFINRLELAPASVRLAYKVLYQALKKAVALHYIPQNPAEGCTLPRLEQEEIKPMDDKQITALMNAAQGTEVEQLIKTALFTGCRLSELLGLTWDCVGRDTITISKQLAQPEQRADGPFISPKNGKSRTLTPATETGAPFDQWRAEAAFKSVLAAAELHGIRFHDLRHTYAVNAIRAGDDIKTVQGNLGHASAAFTLDRYGHFTERMKQDSAARMEGFIRGVLNL